jgi:hypothetical protein
MRGVKTVWVLSVVKIAGLVYPFLYDPLSRRTFGPGRSKSAQGAVHSGVDSTSLIVFLDELLDRHTVRGDSVEFESVVFTNREALLAAICETLDIPRSRDSDLFAWTADG